MEHASQAPGFYGKLPSHGDFVGRRLPPGVRHCLDAWLQRALVQSRSDLGPAWLATWGSSPLWRFVIGAGVCGDEAWAGVMMPSADRVGRCFPLLLAAPVDGTPSLRDCLTLHGDWFATLEELALSALHEAFSLADFDKDLLMLANGLGSRPAIAQKTGTVDGSFPHKIEDGESAWWTVGSSNIALCLLISAGLPLPAQFASLLDGRWEQRGWSRVWHS